MLGCSSVPFLSVREMGGTRPHESGGRRQLLTRAVPHLPTGPAKGKPAFFHPQDKGTGFSGPNPIHQYCAVAQPMMTYFLLERERVQSQRAFSQAPGLRRAFHAVSQCHGDLSSPSISSASLPSADRMLIAAAELFPVEHGIAPQSSEQAPFLPLKFSHA